MEIRDQFRIRAAQLFLAILLFHVSALVYSAEPEVPQIISTGFAAFEKEGAKSAVDAWLAGSALEGDKQVQTQVGLLSGIEGYYGKFRGAFPLKVYRISPASTLTFMELRFDKGQAFAKFLTYRAGKTETITQFFFHTQPEQILPNVLLYPSN